jgi:hypothetical protein
MKFLKLKNIFEEEKYSKNDVDYVAFRENILLEWLIDNDELPEDATLDDITEEGGYYKMDSYEVGGIGYAIGTEEETKDSCYDSIKDLIDTEGVGFFDPTVVKDNLDKDSVVDYAEEFYRDDIYSEPTSYFDENERMLSNKQTEQIEILKMKVERLENGIQIFENNMGGTNDEWFSSKISEFEELVEEYETEIEEIETNPDGDFSDDLIDEKISDILSEVRKNPLSFLNDFGMDYTNFLDKDSLIEDIIDIDGYGQILARYDGEAHEVYVKNELFYIMRID